MEVSMSTFSTNPSELSGFSLDLAEILCNFDSNAQRISNSLQLSDTNPNGLLSTLPSSIDQLCYEYSNEQKQNARTISNFGTSVSIAAQSYQQQDDASASAIATAGHPTTWAFDLPAIQEEDRSTPKFGGMIFPDLPELVPGEFTIRAVVGNCAKLIDHFDEPLNESIGVRPVADYLAPIECDWEILQTLSGRIRQLGINDHTTSENLKGATRSIRTSWSGAASEALESAVFSLQKSIFDRSIDFDHMARIVAQGAEFIERTAYNQAISVCSTLLQPLTHQDDTLPLAVWAQLLDGPGRSPNAAEIEARISDFRRAAEQRKSAIEDVFDIIGMALDYQPGRSLPGQTHQILDAPAKIPADLGFARYGFGDNVWLEESMSSVC